MAKKQKPTPLIRSTDADYKTKHGRVFEQNDIKTLLVLDRVIYSLDDRSMEEIVFATMDFKALGKTLYFVVGGQNYEKLKRENPKVQLSGFWHSMFVNNKIDPEQTSHVIISDEVLYKLTMTEHSISTSFEIDANTSIKSNVDSDLVIFEKLQSQFDKAKESKKNSTIKNAIIPISALICVSIGYFAYQSVTEQLIGYGVEKQKIIKSLERTKNNWEEKKKLTYKKDSHAKVNLRALLLPQFEGVKLSGSIGLKNQDITMSTRSSLFLVHGFMRKYKQYTSGSNTPPMEMIKTTQKNKNSDKKKIKTTFYFKGEL